METLKHRTCLRPKAQHVSGEWLKDRIGAMRNWFWPHRRKNFQIMRAVRFWNECSLQIFQVWLYKDIRGNSSIWKGQRAGPDNHDIISNTEDRSVSLFGTQTCWILFDYNYLDCYYLALLLILKSWKCLATFIQHFSLLPSVFLTLIFFDHQLTPQREEGIPTTFDWKGGSSEFLSDFLNWKFSTYRVGEELAKSSSYIISVLDFILLLLY